MAMDLLNVLDKNGNFQKECDIFGKGIVEKNEEENMNERKKKSVDDKEEQNVTDRKSEPKSEPTGKCRLS